MKSKLTVCNRLFCFGFHLQSVCLFITLSSSFTLSGQSTVNYNFFNRPSLGQIQVNLPKPFQFQPVNSMMPTLLPAGNSVPGLNNNFIEEQNRKILQEHGLLQSTITNPFANAQSAIQMATIERELMEEPFYRAHDEWFVKTKHYRQAYRDLMALNPDSFSLAQVEFTIENAYYDNRYDYKEFASWIHFYAGIVTKILKQEGLQVNNSTALNYGIQKLFRQSNTVTNSSGKLITVKPFRYDFTDWKGEKDYSQLFTTKLLRTGKGQCNSLPRLYLILAEHLGAQASLSLAPQHSFVRFRDQQNRLINFETTNGTIVSTNWLMQSGYINANALKSKTYLDTLSKRQLFGQCLADLLLGYIHKFGYDDMAEQIRQSILQVSPNNSTALIVEANLKRETAIQKIQEAGRPPEKDLPNFPEAYNAYLDMLTAYEKVDATGYQDMPPEAYQEWLKSIEQEKKNQENIQLQQRIKREIENLKKVNPVIINNPRLN